RAWTTALSPFLRPRPPSPPRLPYTTLFRSSIAGPAPPRHVGCAHVRPERWRATRRKHLHQRNRLVAAATPDRRSGVAAATNLFRDRKSTRLNSSHVAISYAVFCLKKKKTR